MVFIIGNIVSLALEKNDQSADDIEIQTILNYVFTIIFLVEALLKIWIQSFRNYI
jgi:hypothetical protein